MAIDDTLDGGQADACSRKIGRRVQALENAEKLFGKIHIEASAIITNKERRLR